MTFRNTHYYLEQLDLVVSICTSCVDAMVRVVCVCPNLKDVRVIHDGQLTQMYALDLWIIPQLKLDFMR